jgi:hypothetical protein
MSETAGIPPSDFSAAFVRFINAMNVEAAKESTPLLDRLRGTP